MKGNISNFIITNPTDVLIKSEHKEKFQTDSGILFNVNPSVIEDRPTKGEVIQVGDEITDIKVGDIIHFSKVAGEDLFFDDDIGVWYIILSYESIFGIEHSA
jgi:co-chaperonin GroES (HSP10)